MGAEYTSSGIQKQVHEYVTPYTIRAPAGGRDEVGMKAKKFHAVVEIDEELYNWLCINSIQRGLNSPDEQDRYETRQRTYQWEQAFRNSQWEKK